MMKYLKQFLIILAISMIGEILKYLLPLPVPASIYGMLILFVGLMTGIIRLESVREAGKFFIATMPVMFIPAGVGLITSWSQLQPFLVPLLVITVVSTFVVMIVTGKVTDFLISKKEGKK